MDAKIRILFQIQKEIEENLIDLTSINHIRHKILSIVQHHRISVDTFLGLTREYTDKGSFLLMLIA